MISSKFCKKITGKTISFKQVCPPPPTVNKVSAQLPFKNKKSFTLAETLITLAIIGIVAALTIPTLLNKYQEQKTVTAVKAFYSQLSNAYKNAIANNGPVEDWGLPSESSWGRPAIAEQTLNMLLPYFKVAKNCGRYQGKCIPGAATSSSNSFALLQNGWSITLYKMGGADQRADLNDESSHLKNVIALVSIELNPQRVANMATGQSNMGISGFTFFLTADGVVVPNGTPDVAEKYSLEKNCNRHFRNGNETGEGCTAWLIYKGNWDYRYRDVSWDE